MGLYKEGLCNSGDITKNFVISGFEGMTLDELNEAAAARFFIKRISVR